MVLAATGQPLASVAEPGHDDQEGHAQRRHRSGLACMVYSGLDVGLRFRHSSSVFMDRGWYAATLAGAALVLLLSVGAALGVRTADRSGLTARRRFEGAVRAVRVHGDTMASMTDKKLAGHLVVERLVAQGITHAFGVPGESYLSVLDGVPRLCRPDTLRHLPPGGRAAFMAEAQAN